MIITVLMATFASGRYNKATSDAAEQALGEKPSRFQHQGLGSDGRS